jgi:hypothetical protein
LLGAKFMSPPRRKTILIAVLSFCAAIFIAPAAAGKNSGFSDVRSDALRTSSPVAEVSQLTPAESAKLRSERFVEVHDAEALPLACKHGFAALTGEPSFSLANPGQPYRATDALASPAGLPWRRLIVGAVSTDRCVVHYERGGFATLYAVVIFDLSKADAPRFIWGGVNVGNQPDVRALISKMAQGTFESGKGHSW